MIDSSDIDQRLIEVVAAALCWAEFGARTHKTRTDDPMSYWDSVHEHARKGYRASAVPLAAYMRGGGKLAIVPETLSSEMLNAARNCLRASEANIRQAWALMLTEAWLRLGKIVRGASP